MSTRSSRSSLFRAGRDLARKSSSSKTKSQAAKTLGKKDGKS
ncbi:hypothetical protein [Paenibacillus sp. Z6-24]